MRLRRLTVRNFRCYKDEISLEIDDMTALVGANDAGKSSLLDALAIFFENQKPDEHDAALDGEKSDMCIACEFDTLPDAILVDATNETSLEAEHLVNESGRLEIHQVFAGHQKSVKAKTFIRAVHPTADGVNDLLKLKISELKQRAKELGIDMSTVNQSVSAELRTAIRDSVDDLKLATMDIAVDDDGAKELFPKIKDQLPGYFLFRSDRPGTDQDIEAQDPMTAAVRLAVEQQAEALAKIASLVNEQLDALVKGTLDHVRNLAPNVADELTPVISPPKWESVFKVSLTSDAQVPLNKRGSGVRRLVLLGFLQAQTQSFKLKNPDRGIIYAVEEPETSQHPDNQRAILQALQELAENEGFQVLTTTHTPNFARLLPTEVFRFLEVNGGSRILHVGKDDETKERIKKALGVMPDHDVRVFVGVEGVHDETFLLHASETLANGDDKISPLQHLVDNGRLIFLPLGGNNLAWWANRMAKLRQPEYHIYDREYELPKDPKYKEQAEAVNRGERCEAHHTDKSELENYLHPDAITAVRPELTLGAIEDFSDVPAIVARAVYDAGGGKDWDGLSDKKRSNKASTAKRWLNNEAVQHMTIEHYKDRGGFDELSNHLRRITELAEAN